MICGDFSLISLQTSSGTGFTQGKISIYIKKTPPQTPDNPSFITFGKISLT
jgi:hypothetical protein